jgi:hypothetical protein
MGRGIAIGALAGALLTFLLFRVAEARRDSGDPKISGAGASSAAPAGEGADGEALRKELAALEADARALEDEIRALDGRIASARSAAQVPAARSGRAAKNPWAALGPRMYKLRDKLKGGEGQMDPEIQALWVDLLAIAKEVTEKYGITMEEFEGAPWGLPMLLIAMLDGSDLPPDAAQSAALDALIASMEEGWKDLGGKRGELSSLELTRAMLGLSGGLLNGLDGLMTPEQRALFDGSEFGTEKVRIRSQYISGGPETWSPQLLSIWQRELKLDDSQQAAIRPIADQWIRDYQALDAEFSRRTAAGERISPAEREIAEADLMIATQKTISESLRLSEEQAKRLRKWSTLYKIGDPFAEIK